MAIQFIPSKTATHLLDNFVDLALDAYERGLERLEKAKKARKARKELQQFSKKELRDMGIYRCEIDRVTDENNF